MHLLLWADKRQQKGELEHFQEMKLASIQSRQDGENLRPWCYGRKIGAISQVSIAFLLKHKTRWILMLVKPREQLKLSSKNFVANVLAPP